MQAAIHLARAYRTLERDVEAERWEVLVRTQLQLYVKIDLREAELRDVKRWTSCRHCNSGEWLMRGLESLFDGPRPAVAPVVPDENLTCDSCDDLPRPGQPLLLCSRCRSARCASFTH